MQELSVPIFQQHTVMMPPFIPWHWLAEECGQMKTFRLRRALHVLNPLKTIKLNIVDRPQYCKNPFRWRSTSPSRAEFASILLWCGVRCCVEILIFNKFRAPSGFLRWRVLVPRSTIVPSIACRCCCVCPMRLYIFIILLRAPDPSPPFQANIILNFPSLHTWIPRSWTSAWQKVLVGLDVHVAYARS